MTIEIKDVSKSFNGQKVLDNFNLNIESEHSYILTGPSGCGKTTLLRLILGLEEPDNGTVKLLGDYKYPFINSGVVFQEDRLCEDYDAVTNVTMVSKKVFRQTVIEELKKLLPEDALFKPVKELSGGQRRRVAIVRACAIPSDVLIMDEPFTGLDDKSREAAIAYIRDKQGTGPLVITTHDTKGLEFGRLIDLGAKP
ncbi:MAG: ABC transporter ATP-binding protein [Butyrivibrio sp.]|uniref:ABC transporter ATP-binding protein n=1 Tax=Butyrivibrio sp. TaxID=28121 RepID=UPI001B5FE402|nr:ATP-binding cassette domain-containing protein [Butyrivibrio sp.]MBP3782960.1 ABC transporter ATP-binding protein [Butyrivibrio sp.]MBP3813037.1 ABC transporter ATP-binding protein [Butyrivibrio sp.]